MALGHHEQPYFDEVYYVPEARALLVQGVEDGRAAHPPLGKWLIGSGIALVGDGASGWRAPSAVAGTATVLLTYLLAGRLGASRGTALLAGLLLALDGLALTMSRIAMLDAFLTLFVTLGALLLVVGLDVGRRPDSPIRLLPLHLAGVAFGLATAVKWTGVLALAVALLLFVAELGRRRCARGGPARPSGREVARGVVALVAVPAVVYLGSFAVWFAHYPQSHAARERCAAGACATPPVDRLAVWWEEQLELVGYHRDLPATHSYQSSPLGWPLLSRPVLAYFERCPPPDWDEDGVCRVAPGREAKILTLGNPVLWWGGVLAVPALVRHVGRRGRRWAAVPLLFVVGQHLPWLLTGKDGYLFYLTPATPFLALAVAMTLTTSSRLRRAGPPVVAGLALAAFVYFSPLWYGVEVPSGLLDQRIWFGSWR